MWGLTPSPVHMRPSEPDPLFPLRVDVINGWPLMMQKVIILYVLRCSILTAEVSWPQKIAGVQKIRNDDIRQTLGSQRTLLD